MLKAEAEAKTAERTIQKTCFAFVRCDDDLFRFPFLKQVNCASCPIIFDSKLPFISIQQSLIGRTIFLSFHFSVFRSMTQSSGSALIAIAHFLRTNASEKKKTYWIYDRRHCRPCQKKIRAAVRMTHTIRVQFCTCANASVRLCTNRIAVNETEAINERPSLSVHKMQNSNKQTRPTTFCTYRFCLVIKIESKYANAKEMVRARARHVNCPGDDYNLWFGARSAWRVNYKLIDHESVHVWACLI